MRVSCYTTASIKDALLPAFFVTFLSQFWIKKTCHFRKILLINFSVFFVNKHTRILFESLFLARNTHASK